MDNESSYRLLIYPDIIVQCGVCSSSCLVIHTSIQSWFCSHNIELRWGSSIHCIISIVV
jgi:hypothetical protein